MKNFDQPITRYDYQHVAENGFDSINLAGFGLTDAELYAGIGQAIDNASQLYRSLLHRRGEQVKVGVVVLSKRGLERT